MIVFLAHTWHPATAARFRRLHHETAGLMPCRLLLQSDRGPVVAAWTRYLTEHGLGHAITLFDPAALAPDLGLSYLEGDSITPGCTHYPLLWFAQTADAQHFWVVESDVDYTGSWREFFCAFEHSGADLLAAHLARYPQNPEWHWWPSLRLPSGTPAQSLQRWKAFLPVYRISARALDQVASRQRQGWQGHYEALLPTLLASDGFDVGDLRDEVTCYLGTAVDPWQPPSTWSSLRWRPPISTAERQIRALGSRPCLLHPIKDGPEQTAGAGRPARTTRAARVSVVMATFNGLAHLGPQLASLEAQTRPPDEVIIVDDASDDGTYDHLVAFGATSRLGVRVHRQPHRVGYVRNFADALAHATGDLLLFCDQDDIWHEDKIGALETAFGDGDWDVLTHDIRIVGADAGENRTRHPSFFRYLDESGLPRDLCVKGHTQGVRASFLRTWGWPPPEGFSHDVWPALVSTLLGTRGYLDRVLVDHRLHGGNASGWLPSHRDLRLLTVDDLRSEVAAGEIMLDMLLAHDRQARLDVLTRVLATSGPEPHRDALATVARYRARQV